MNGAGIRRVQGLGGLALALALAPAVAAAGPQVPKELCIEWENGGMTQSIAMNMMLKRAPGTLKLANLIGGKAKVQFYEARGIVSSGDLDLSGYPVIEGTGWNYKGSDFLFLTGRITSFSEVLWFRGFLSLEDVSTGSLTVTDQAGADTLGSYQEVPCSGVVVD